MKQSAFAKYAERNHVPSSRRRSGMRWWTLANTKNEQNFLTLFHSAPSLNTRNETVRLCRVSGMKLNVLPVFRNEIMCIRQIRELGEFGPKNSKSKLFRRLIRSSSDGFLWPNQFSSEAPAKLNERNVFSLLVEAYFFLLFGPVVSCFMPVGDKSMSLLLFYVSICRICMHMPVYPIHILTVIIQNMSRQMLLWLLLLLISLIMWLLLFWFLTDLLLLL